MKVFMKEAFALAKEAYQNGEVPVGAIIVKDGKIISRAYNLCEASNDSTAHAEMMAIWDACRVLETSDLSGCEIYVTMEPCPMCMGAIILSRLSVLVYGCDDYEFGAAGGYCNLSTHSKAKNLIVYGGIMEAECSDLVKDFFFELRKKSSRKNLGSF